MTSLKSTFHYLPSVLVSRFCLSPSLSPSSLCSLQLSLFFPIIYCMCSVFLVVVPLFSDTINSLVGIAVALSGAPVYYICIHLPPKSRPAFCGKLLGKRRQLRLVCSGFVNLRAANSWESQLAEEFPCGCGITDGFRK